MKFKFIMFSSEKQSEALKTSLEKEFELIYFIFTSWYH